MQSFFFCLFLELKYINAKFFFFWPVFRIFNLMRVLCNYLKKTISLTCYKEEEKRKGRKKLKKTKYIIRCRRSNC